MSTSSSDSDRSRFTNDKHLNTPEKVAKIDALRKETRSAKQTDRRFREKVKEITQNHSEDLGIN